MPFYCSFLHLLAFMLPLRMTDNQREWQVGKQLSGLLGRPPIIFTSVPNLLNIINAGCCFARCLRFVSGFDGRKSCSLYGDQPEGDYNGPAVRSFRRRVSRMVRRYTCRRVPNVRYFTGRPILLAYFRV